MKKILILLALANFVQVNAQDRLFTYTYQSTVLNKGQRELEIWNTMSTGRNDFYSRLDNRTEFEIGLGHNLQTAFYLNLTSKTSTLEDASGKYLKTGNEMESWNQGIKFIDEWSYFDAQEKKLGWLKLLGKIDSIRKTQWTVHYKL